MSFESHVDVDAADKLSGDLGDLGSIEAASLIFRTVGRPRAEPSVASQQFFIKFR